MLAKSPRQSSKKNVVDPKNRMNDLTSRQWLPFQKSWFLHQRNGEPNATINDFITFFTKRRQPDGQPARIGVFAANADHFVPAIIALGREAIVLDESFDLAGLNIPSPSLDYALIDLCEIFGTSESYRQQRARWFGRIAKFSQLLRPQCYLTVFVRNLNSNGGLLPVAWETGKNLSQHLAMKDEKIGCEATAETQKLSLKYFKSYEAETTTARDATPKLSFPENSHSAPQSTVWRTRRNVFYCLNFRKDEVSESNNHQLPQPEASTPRSITPVSINGLRPRHSSWLVPRPPQREKGVLLHPAKFPESLVEYFVRTFTVAGEAVFDPMAGTGSALLSALACRRRAYGIELSEQFHAIAVKRLIDSTRDNKTTLAWHLSHGDANKTASYDSLPRLFDYVLTSPPYWDMLRMKGAETQQNRQKAGLLQFYSDDEHDLGNEDDYTQFLGRLMKIYQRVAKRIRPGRYMTIIVKNVKKKGKIYPLAWDLALALQNDLTLCHEQFWCQDDQKIAPFGYRYAWVSNTFHHYCLHFQRLA